MTIQNSIMTEAQVYAETRRVRRSVTIMVALTAAYLIPRALAQTDCTASPVTCAPISMTADPYSTSGHFAGYADPSARRDPLTGKLWLAYSWPTVLADGSQVVDIHVLYSEDNGVTWTNEGLDYGGVLYSTAPELNCALQPCVTADSSHEVVDIYPQQVGTSVYWYGIHYHYDVPPGGSAFADYSYTEWQVMVGCQDTTGGIQGPMCLSQSSPQYMPQLLGYSEDNEPSLPVNVNLTTLSGMPACTSFREPTFLMEGSTLYLFMNCGNMTSYAQFATVNPQANLGNWTWTYSGARPVASSSGFATQADAQSLCSLFATCAQTNFLTQGEVALAAGGEFLGLYQGTPIMLFDLVYMTPAGKVAAGLVVTGLATVSPPTFQRGSSGNILVYGAISSPDSLSTGPGTGTYVPGAMTGIVLAHKNTDCAAATAGCDAQGGEFLYLMATEAKP